MGAKLKVDKSGVYLMSNIPAGWYIDPENNSEQRYWDGQQWTDYKSAAAAAAGPGWYVNPENNNQKRYWDGKKWTEHTTETKSIFWEKIENKPVGNLQKRVIPTVFMIIWSLGFMGIPAYILIFGLHPDNATVAKGYVVAVEREYGPGTNKRGGEMVCWALIEYYVGDTKYEGVSYKTSSCPWTEEDVVEIEYNAQNPKEMVVTQNNTVLLWAFIIIGTAVCSLMGYLIVKGKLVRKRATIIKIG